MKFLKVQKEDLEQEIPDSVIEATKGVSLPPAGSYFVEYSLVLDVENDSYVAVGLRDCRKNRVAAPSEAEEEEWFKVFGSDYLTISEINVIISNSDGGDLNV